MTSLRGPLHIVDVLSEIGEFLHLPIRLDTAHDRSPSRHDLWVGDWLVTENALIKSVKRTVAQLLLNGWTGWDIHHCHEACALHHNARHNGRPHNLSYANEGQLMGLVLHRAELTPLSCALAPIPPLMNRVLSSRVMTADLLGPRLNALNSVDLPVDKDLWDVFVDIQSPLSITKLGFSDEKARGLWEDAVDRIELARVIIPTLDDDDENEDI